MCLWNCDHVVIYHLSREELWTTEDTDNRENKQEKRGNTKETAEWLTQKW